MPFGPSAGPLTWQRTVNTIFAPFINRGIHVYVYLDDIIKHNLQLKISICTFYARDFEYLGHILNNEGIKANPKKVQAIKDYPLR